MNGVIQLVDMMAVGVFAISGALAAAERKLDVLGFILFGTITGIGGGTPVAIALALALRAAAILCDLRLPKYGR